MTEPPGPESMPDVNSLSFEEAFQELTETVKSLETGGLTLEKATAYYQSGMSLARWCNQLLSETELKISQLKDSYTGVSGIPSWDEDESLENA